MTYGLKMPFHTKMESLLFERSDRAAGAVSNFPRFFDGSPLRLLFYRLKKSDRRCGKSPSGLRTSNWKSNRYKIMLA